MRILADECCDAGLVEALTADGHDLVSVAAVSPGAKDPEVLSLAVGSGRLLLTEDRDFGELIYAGLSKHEGVLFVRFPGNARQAMIWRTKIHLRAGRRAARGILRADTRRRADSPTVEECHDGARTASRSPSRRKLSVCPSRSILRTGISSLSTKNLQPSSRKCLGWHLPDTASCKSRKS